MIRINPNQRTLDFNPTEYTDEERAYAAHY